MKTKLIRIAEISKERPKEVFTSIYHLINKELLLQCHKELDGKKATGLDGVTKAEYNENLTGNINDLLNRLKTKTYYPTPAKRVYIPKANGKVRGLAIAIYEDKIVQLATTKLIQSIFENKLSSSLYGFRPNRSCHRAINKLIKIIQNRSIKYIVDADIKGYFDNIDHKWLIECIKQHIKDPNVLNLINRFLKAGILEKGEIEKTIKGTPQGSILSPVLANIYMHYVLALWFEKKVKRNFIGECHLIVYADDYVCCFEYYEEAELFYKQVLPKRLSKFRLRIRAKQNEINTIWKIYT